MIDSEDVVMSFDAKKYWDDRLNAQYDLVGVGDISLSANYNKWSYKITRLVLKRLLKKYSANHSKMIDIGSGTGFIVEIGKSLGKSITGIDISKTAVERLQKIYPSFSFLEFDMGSDKINLPDSSFGVCTAASVLYHIVDDKALKITFSNIHRLLEKDGIFIFSDNFIHNKEFNVTHQKCRTLDEYMTALSEAGFEVIARVPNYVLMNEPMDARGKFYPRIWNRLTNLSRKSKFLDSIIWPVVYPFEILLTSTLKESPAQEFMICKAIK